MNTTVGVLGIGAMGLPMASRLHQAGFAVTAADISDKQVSRAEELGITASTDTAVLASCDVLIVLVATPAQLLGLLDNDLLADGNERTVVVMSTVGVAAVREFAATARRHPNIAVADCPVTGGVAGAQAGHLTLFCAGEESVTGKLVPVLTPLGAIRACGTEPGQGQAVKIVNQVLAAGNLAVAAEALALAEALDLDPATVLPLVQSGAGGSWMLGDRGPRMALPAEDRPSHTHVSIFAKDTGLVLSAAHDAGITLPLSEAAAELFSRAAEKSPTSDDSSVIDAIARSNPSH